MGTKSLRLFLVILVLFWFIVVVVVSGNHLNANRQRITLSGLFTRSNYPSIRVALDQVNSIDHLSPANFELVLNETEGITDCDVGNGVKTFFDMLNRPPSRSILLTDACQNVLSHVAETATYLHLPVFSFADSDLSLSAQDRYPLFYRVVPSDHAHNLVRKQLLQYFNWTRFGLIYQHGSQYTLVANDFSKMLAIDKKQWEVNLTRGLTYRQGEKWTTDNSRYLEAVLKDIKARDVRIIIANLNQTIANHMFCHAAREHVYGPRYQWLILGYPTLSAWWWWSTSNEKVNCTMQELIRAINGTLQTRVPRVSIDEFEIRSDDVSNYLKNFSNLQTDYFDAYAYDSIWSLAFLFRQFYNKYSNNSFDRSKPGILRRAVNNIDFVGATGRVRYLNGERMGEVLVEQLVACRMMEDGSCLTPCYENEECNLTVVKIFLVKHAQSIHDPPVLYKLNSIMWHGHGPPRDRTNQTVAFQHIRISVFVSISICSGIGLFISCTFLAFNGHFRSHRYIRMSSPSLNNLILVGCMFAYICMIFMGINSSLFSWKLNSQILMNIICPTRVWLLCIGFTLAFGSMFSKTWRVHSIFTNINITKRGIHDSRLLAIVGLLLSIDLFFLVAWQIFDPIQRQIIHDMPYRLKYNQDIEIIPHREECKSQNMPLWLVLLILYKGLLMFYGSFLAWKTRRVSISALNDSRYIGLSVYIVFILCILGSLVTFIPAEQIELSYLLMSFFIVICTTVTVCLVFVPKIIEVYRDPYSRTKQPRPTIRNQTTQPKSPHPAVLTIQRMNAAILDNEQLKLVLSMQEQTLERLMDQLNNWTTQKNSIAEPLELERLIVSDDDAENEEENFTMEDDEDSSFRITSNCELSPKGRVSRAVSLCIFNKIHMGQLYWPETAGMGRCSISQHPSHLLLPSNKTTTVLRTTYFESHTGPAIETSSEKDMALVEIDEEEEELPMAKLYFHDGLVSLDENQLNEMIETDLVSSSNG